MFLPNPKNTQHVPKLIKDNCKSGKSYKMAIVTANASLLNRKIG